MKNDIKTIGLTLNREYAKVSIRTSAAFMVARRQRLEVLEPAARLGLSPACLRDYFINHSDRLSHVLM